VCVWHTGVEGCALVWPRRVARPTGVHQESKKLSIVPKAGMAVVHFPATTQQYMCIPDLNTLHEGAAATAPKYIIQQFIWSVPINAESTAVHEHVRAHWARQQARVD